MQFRAKIIVYRVSSMSEFNWLLKNFLETISFSFDYSSNEFV